VPFTGHGTFAKVTKICGTTTYRRVLISTEFGKWSAYTIWCTDSSLFEEPFTKNFSSAQRRCARE
jgi:hypothetical protein